MGSRVRLQGGCTSPGHPLCSWQAHSLPLSHCALLSISSCCPLAGMPSPLPPPMFLNTGGFWNIGGSSSSSPAGMPPRPRPPPTHLPTPHTPHTHTVWHTQEDYSEARRTLDTWAFVFSLRARLWLLDQAWTYPGGQTPEVGLGWAAAFDAYGWLGGWGWGLTPGVGLGRAGSAGWGWLQSRAQHSQRESGGAVGPVADSELACATQRPG